MGVYPTMHHSIIEFSRAHSNEIFSGVMLQRYTHLLGKDSLSNSDWLYIEGMEETSCIPAFLSMLLPVK